MNDDLEIKLSSKPRKKDGFWRRFFAHPIVQGIVLLTGLFGLYAFYSSIKEPELTFYVSPTRVPLVQLGGATNYLEVKRLAPIREFIQIGQSNGPTNTFFLPAHAYLEYSNNVAGKWVKSSPLNDVSTLEVQIWNQGKAPIHTQDIAKQIRLRFPNGEEFLQVTLSQNSDTIEFSQAPDPTNPASLNLDWKLLQHNDGVKLQIVYVGGINAPLVLEGSIEGQQQGIKEYRREQTTKGTYNKQSFVMGIMMALFFILFKSLSKTLPQKFVTSISAFLSLDVWITILSILMASVLVTFLFEHNLFFVTTPPFGY